MFENKIEITTENVLVLTRFNPHMAMHFAENMLKKREEGKIVEIFKLAQSDTLTFICRHPELASVLADTIPEKIDEIINIADLAKEDLVKLALLFPEKMLSIARINPDAITLIFYEAMDYAGNEIKDEIVKRKYDLIQTKISEVGQEFPDMILPILKEVKEFRNKCFEAEKIIISTAKFFPQNAVEIALNFSLELKIAIEVPGVAAKIAIEKPELAFDIIEAVPASEKEIREYFTLKCK